MPYARVLGRDASAGLDGRGLDHDGSCPSERILAQVNQVPVRQVPIGGAVSTHGRDNEAVVYSDPAGGEWSEEGWRIVRVKRGSRLRALAGRVVRDVLCPRINFAGRHDGRGPVIVSA